MAIRFYIMAYTTIENNTGPKYLPRRVVNPDAIVGLEGLEGRFMRYGSELCGLVALDVSPAQHALLTGLPDVSVVPANLDNNLGANVATVEAELEAFNIPAENLLPSFTFRQVLRFVAFIFLVAQKLRGRSVGELFADGRNLSTTLAQLPVGVRTALQESAEELGVDYSSLNGSSTIRQALRLIGNSAQPLVILGVDV